MKNSLERQNHEDELRHEVIASGRVIVEDNKS